MLTSIEPVTSMSDLSGRYTGADNTQRWVLEEVVQWRRGTSLPAELATYAVEKCEKNSLRREEAPGPPVLRGAR